MAGIEVIGLALGIYPIVVDLIDRYRGIIESRDTELLVETLKTHGVVFRNSIELLLKSIVPETELNILLSDLGGAAWKESSLAGRFNCLGPDAEFILQSTGDIYKTLRKLEQKLIPKDSNTDSTTFATRTRRIVKNFFSGSRDVASLARMEKRIRDFDMLARGSAMLAPTRQKLSRGLHDLSLFREYAHGLYNALQSGLTCSCGQLHPANIELDDWCLLPGDKHNQSSVKFSFLCAEDARNADQQNWITAETTGSLSTTSSSKSSATSASDSVLADDDLCSLVNPPIQPGRTASRRRQLSISDPQGRNYNLSNHAEQKPTVQSGKLKDFLGMDALSFPIRAQLALKLATAVLQISYTGWLEGKWTKDNIMVRLPTPEDPRAYISHQFQSALHSPRPPTLAPASPDHTLDLISDPPLFFLGVFMLEMCYNRTIESMATEAEKSAAAFQPLLTAIRLARKVRYDFGAVYANAVDASLQQKSISRDAKGVPTDYPQYARHVEDDIVEPLRTFATVFGISPRGA